jgi:hypothetical protein
MAVTTFEKGSQKGQRTMLRKLLEARLGPLSASPGQRLGVLGPEGLDALALELLNAQSLREPGLED